MNFQLVKKSSNAKTGPIPTSNSPRVTCPPACPLSGKGGCYAEAGYHTRLNWDALDNGKRGTDWESFCKAIASLPPGQLWRHNVSGDLPPASADVLSESHVMDLVKANAGKKGFTYTHYPLTRHNAAIVRKANKGGFTINASANNLEQARGYHKRGFPTVTIVSESQHGKNWGKLTLGDMTVIQCPAETRDNVSCATCKLCQHNDRSVVIGFTVHGTQSKNADVIARG